MSGLRFKRTSDVFKQFYYKNLVLHQQNEADCVLYAAWNAIEVLSGPTHEPPPFMTISVPKDGMHMKALHDKSAFLHYLQRKNLTGDFSRHLYNQTVTPAIIRRELTSGVVVVGLKLSLLSGQKVAQIRPDLPDSVLHSICLVGYCFVRDKCYFIAKDSSGDKRTNDVLLLEYDETQDPRGIDTLEVHESAPAQPPRIRTSSDRWACRSGADAQAHPPLHSVRDEALRLRSPLSGGCGERAPELMRRLSDVSVARRVEHPRRQPPCHAD